MIPERDPRYQISADLALPEFKSKRTATMEILCPLWRNHEQDRVLGGRHYEVVAIDLPELDGQP